MNFTYLKKFLTKKEAKKDYKARETIMIEEDIVKSTSYY